MTGTDTEVVTPTKLAHVVLRSGRFAETVTWWKTVLGAHAVFEAPFVAFLTYDDEHHRLAIINVGDGAPPPAEGTAGFEHVAFTYRDLDALVRTYERLTTEGIEPYWCINHGFTLSMYFRDPDGHQMEMQVDLGTVDDATGFMASPTFEANPIGVDFDPVELVRQHRAGERPSALDLYGPGAGAGAGAADS